MLINDPIIVAEVRDCFARYETALMANDVDMLNHFFWEDPRVLRYGVGQCLYGHKDIASFRRAVTSVADRNLQNTTIMTYGRDFATANTEFVHGGDARLGRQTQTWVRMPEGWRITAAHVSYLDEGTA